MPSDSAMSGERAIRRLLIGVLLLGIAGVSADLLLLDHVESATQRIPVIVLALSIVMLVSHLLVRRRGTVRLLQAVFLTFIACGGLGAYFHFEGNSAFQLEIDPDLSQRDLIWKALRAKAPPALAPLAFVQLGLVGLVWSYRHPLLHRSMRSS